MFLMTFNKWYTISLAAYAPRTPLFTSWRVAFSIATKALVSSSTYYYVHFSVSLQLKKMPVSRKVQPANTKFTVAHPNMFKSMRIPHIIGSCLGLLPIRGITSDSPEKLRFRWFSLNTTYTLCYFLIGSYFLIMDIKQRFKRSERINSLSNNVSSKEIIQFTQMFTYSGDSSSYSLYPGHYWVF